MTLIFWRVTMDFVYNLIWTAQAYNKLTCGAVTCSRIPTQRSNIIFQNIWNLRASKGPCFYILSCFVRKMVHSKIYVDWSYIHRTGNGASSIIKQSLIPLLDVKNVAADKSTALWSEDAYYVVSKCLFLTRWTVALIQGRGVKL